MRREPSGSEQTFVVRQALPADADGVTALLQGIYGEQDFFVGAAAAPASALRSRLEYSRSEESLYSLALAAPDRGGEVVGWLELHRQGAVRMRHVATLTLAVAKRARRGGIGRALLRDSYAWCLRVGVKKISLNVRESNAAAIGLYLSEGFEQEGRERAAVRLGPLSELESPHAVPRYEDNLVMARFLADPSLH